MQCTYRLARILEWIETRTARIACDDTSSLSELRHATILARDATATWFPSLSVSLPFFVPKAYMAQRAGVGHDPLLIEAPG